MPDIAWFQARLEQLCAIGDFGDTKRRIYDGLVVDGYEFGRVEYSQINLSILRSISLMLDNIRHEIGSCHGHTDRVTTQCDPVNAPHTPNIHHGDIRGEVE